MLTPAQVVEIRTMVAAGQRQAAVAKKFGVCAPHVSDIVTGKRHAKAGGPITKRKPPRQVTKPTHRPSAIPWSLGGRSHDRIQRILDSHALSMAVEAART